MSPSSTSRPLGSFSSTRTGVEVWEKCGQKGVSLGCKRGKRGRGVGCGQEAGQEVEYEAL